ncbi:MAG TPA: hypothetical protein VEN81_10710, partial [Planctomycetota bacterium]|nr:hypothetical protein [Planctomycetota bacterium]
GQAYARQTSPEKQMRAIYFARERIGEAETLSEPMSGGGIRLRSRMLMRLKPFGLPASLEDEHSYMSSDVRLDRSFQLSDSRMVGQIQSIPFQARADRQGDKLHVVLEVKPLFKTERVVPFPQDATLSDSFNPYQGGVKMAEGRKWKMKMFDVESLVMSAGKSDSAIVERYAAVTGREAVLIRDREVSAYKVVVRAQPNDEERWIYQMWVDDEGTVLKTQSKFKALPFDIVLEEKRTLTEDEANKFVWSIQPPR